MGYLKLFHNEEYLDKKDSNKKTKVSVRYCSQDCNYNREAYQIFDEYMANEFDYTKNDIVDIVTKIREITKGLPESSLEVSIDKNGYYEWASYKRGYFNSAGVYKKDCNNRIDIDVSATNKGIDIEFKDADFNENSEKEMNRINQELKPMYDKTIKLRNLSRVRSFIKEIAALKKCYIAYMNEDLMRGNDTELIEMDGFIGYLKLTNDYRDIRLSDTFFEEVGFIIDKENRALKLASEKKKKSGYSKVKKSTN